MAAVYANTVLNCSIDKEVVMMKVIKLMMIASLSIIAIGCSSTETEINSERNIDDIEPQTCSNEWFTQIEQQIMTGDGQGHGPDLGSSEWRSVVEFRLGIRGDANIPPRNSEQWCAYINTINTTR